MDAKRAQYLLDNIRYGEFPMAFPRKFAYKGGTIHADGITEQEDQEIRALWKTMPGDTCYHHAVRCIAEGEETVPDFTAEQRAKLEGHD